MANFNPYKFAEKCLYDYRMNNARLKVLTEDLRVLRSGTDAHIQQYDKPTGQLYIMYDPVASYVERIDALENKIKRIERNTTPITTLRNDLQQASISNCNKKNDYLKDLYYFDGNSLDSVAQELHCSRSTLYHRRRGLVTMAVHYLGF